jgi:Tfp pilus assembly protein PilZ
MVDYLCDTGLHSEPATTLGAGGLFIESESPLSEGYSLKMRFRLPGSSHTHEIEGRVAWCKRATDPSHHSPGMGIEFTDRDATILLARELERLK